MLETATVALSAGWPAVVDAAFLLRAERDEFAVLAESMAVPFTIFDCKATLPLLLLRLERRQSTGADPSEADAAVLNHFIDLRPHHRALHIVLAISPDWWHAAPRRR